MQTFENRTAGRLYDQERIQTYYFSSPSYTISQPARASCSLVLNQGPFEVFLSLANEVDEVKRFAHEKNFCSYMGLIPSTYASGGRTHHGRLTRQGNRYLRWALVEAIWPAIRRDQDLRTYYQRIKVRKGRNTAKVATARRLVTIVYRVLTQTKPYRVFGSRPPCM